MYASSFKITSDQDGTGKHIFVDGKEINGCTGAEVCIRVNEMPTVTLEFFSDNIECDLNDIYICGVGYNPKDFPVEVCKFYQNDGKCTELVDRICGFKKFDYDRFCSVCTKFKPEQDGEG